MGRWHDYWFKPDPRWSEEALAQDERFQWHWRMRGRMEAAIFGFAMGTWLYAGLVNVTGVAEPVAASVAIPLGALVTALFWRPLASWPPGPLSRSLSVVASGAVFGVLAFAGLVRGLSVDKPLAGAVGVVVGGFGVLFMWWLHKRSR